jgi:glycoside/pentoside/hexuronide:cation symporter, GPH family
MTATASSNATGQSSAGSSPEEDKVPTKSKLAYAIGGTTDIFGHWLYNGMANPVFNGFFGLSPTQVGFGLGVARMIDAFTDPLFGWLSDNTRSKWGRRRPFILFGSIIAGVALPFLFLPSMSWDKNTIFWFMLISTALYAPIISAYNMPYQSLGSELTPDYDERTTIMGWKAVTQKISGMLLGWGLWFATLPMFTDPATGKPNMAIGAACAAAIAGFVMILSGLLNFFFAKERYYGLAKLQEKVGFTKMFTTFTCKPYLVLLGTALVYAIPTGLVGSLGYYATTYYVLKGDMHASGTFTGYGGAAYALCGVAGVPAATWLARTLGKKKALTYTLGAGLVAFGSAWWLYTPANPWLSVLCTGMNGFSATGLWVILPSMCVDVVDYDEMRSGKRREGAYNSTFSWVLKVGMSASMFLVGPLLDNLTRFDVKLGGHQDPNTILWIRILFTGIPVAALLIAFFLVQLYPLTRERMQELREELEARRGTVPGAEPSAESA